MVVHEDCYANNATLPSRMFMIVFSYLVKFNMVLLTLSIFFHSSLPHGMPKLFNVTSLYRLGSTSPARCVGEVEWMTPQIPQCGLIASNGYNGSWTHSMKLVGPSCGWYIKAKEYTI